MKTLLLFLSLLIPVSLLGQAVSRNELRNTNNILLSNIVARLATNNGTSYAQALYSPVVYVRQLLTNADFINIYEVNNTSGGSYDAITGILLVNSANTTNTVASALTAGYIALDSDASKNLNLNATFSGHINTKWENATNASIDANSGGHVNSYGIDLKNITISSQLGGVANYRIFSDTNLTVTADSGGRFNGFIGGTTGQTFTASFGGDINARVNTSRAGNVTAQSGAKVATYQITSTNLTVSAQTGSIAAIFGESSTGGVARAAFGSVVAGKVGGTNESLLALGIGSMALGQNVKQTNNFSAAVGRDLTNTPPGLTIGTGTNFSNLSTNGDASVNSLTIKNANTNATPSIFLTRNPATGLVEDTATPTGSGNFSTNANGSPYFQGGLMTNVGSTAFVKYMEAYGTNIGYETWSANPISWSISERVGSGSEQFLVIQGGGIDTATFGTGNRPISVGITGDLTVDGTMTVNVFSTGKFIVLSNTVEFPTLAWTNADLNLGSTRWIQTNSMTGNQVFAVTNVAGTTNSAIHFVFEGEAAGGTDRFVTNTVNSIGNTIPVLLRNGSAAVQASPLVWKIPAGTVLEGDIEFTFQRGTNFGNALTNLYTR